MAGKPHRGLALIAVLWITAALSILLAGMMQATKGELKLASRTRDLLVASGQGEAAMQLVLRAMVRDGVQADRTWVVNTSFLNVPIAVQVMPLTGYIDINHAGPELLARMFVSAASLSQEDASVLAQAVVATRDEKNAKGRRFAFEAAEDLLRVPGLSYDIYALVQHLVTADISGSGLVNPQAAPAPVLAVLSNGNESQVERLIASREAGDVGVDTSMLNGAWLDSAASKQVELQARVPLADGSTVIVLRRFAVGPSSEDGLPWRVFYAETRSVDPSAP